MRLPSAARLSPAVERKLTSATYLVVFLASLFTALRGFGKVSVCLHPDTLYPGSTAMQLTNDFLLVTEAAEFLGVSPNTIRNWGRDGKITEYRHPVNNYRLFKRKDLERIRKKLVSPEPRRVKPR